MIKPKLLLVDDDIRFTHNVLWLLARKSYQVSSANDGEAALRILNNSEIDVAILDQVMPGLDGLEILRILKRNWPCTEVIILTSIPMPDMALKGLELGAYDYAAKPIGIYELEHKILHAFEHKSLAEARLPHTQLLL